MKATSPLQSDQQQVGRLGEAAVTGFFASAGWIVHPPLSGGDFGIDARVEIVDEQGEVTGLEFFVQVKATNGDVAESQELLNLGSFAVGTIEYLYAKPAPTLLALYAARQQGLFWGWLPEIVSPDRLVKAIRGEQKTLSLSMKRRELCESELGEIHKVVHRAAINRGAESVRAVIRKDLLFLYRVAANCLDLLIDWLGAEMLASTEISPIKDTECREGDSEVGPIQKLDTLTRLTLPVRLLYQSLRMCLDIAENPAVECENPGIWNSRKLLATIEALYMGCYETEGEDLRELAWESLLGTMGRDKVVFLNVPARQGRRNFALMALAIRDYLAVLRDGVFPKLFSPDPPNPVNDLSEIHQGWVGLWLSHLPPGEERDRLAAVFNVSGKRDHD